jgi:hypothetical protein
MKKNIAETTKILDKRRIITELEYCLIDNGSGRKTIGVAVESVAVAKLRQKLPAQNRSICGSLKNTSLRRIEGWGHLGLPAPNKPWKAYWITVKIDRVGLVFCMLVC